ncbi:MAG: DUF6011 domain-containing protein [Candidatus Odinarchaeota archaeon]
MTKCCRCGKPLSNKRSIEIGMGPVCRKKKEEKQKQNEMEMYKGEREENEYPSFSDYFKQILADTRNKDKTICACGTKVLDGDFNHYMSEFDGWWLKGWKYQQWLYLECPKCLIARAFHHLRISRPFGNEPVSPEVITHAKQTMDKLHAETRKQDAKERMNKKSKPEKESNLTIFLEV